MATKSLKKKVESKPSRIQRDNNKNSTQIPNIYPKTKNQEHLVDCLENDTVVVAAGSAGTGKAQPLYSKILTKDGWKKMKDIRVGETVRSLDNWCTVTGVFPQGKKKIIRFFFKDGATVDSCEDHLWSVHNSINRSSSKEETLSTKEIMQLLDSRLKRNVSISPLIASELYNENTHIIHPYILGCLIGDGNFATATPAITSIDKEILDRISLLLPENIVLSHRPSAKISYGIVSSTKSNPNIVQKEIVRLQMYGKRSFEKSIPQEYFKDSIYNRKQLLAGLFDTDGYVDKNGIISYSTTSKVLAEQVRDIVFELGGKASIKSRIPQFTYKGEKKSGRVCFNVNINIPNKEEYFYLTRKKDRLRNTDVTQLRRVISSYEILADEDCQCIMVDHPSHLYVTDGYVLTHNTFLACHHAAKQVYTGRTKQIILIRAYQPLAGRSIGFLPGELEEKLFPYYAQMISYLKDLLTPARVEIWLKSGVIEICSLETIRGRSWDYATIIVDECFDPSTEVLTRDGFKRFDSLQENEQIASYKEDGSITFEIPSRLVVKDYNGEMVKHYRDQFSMQATAGHSAVFEIDGNLHKQRFDAKLNWKAKIPTTGVLSNQSIKDTSVIIDCALQADGTYSKASTNSPYWEIQFSKERKITRFRQALIDAGIKYSEYARDKAGRIKFYLPKYSPKLFVGNLKEKNFDLSKILEYSYAQQFIDEVKYWDSHIRGENYTYCSTNLHNIEVVQAIAHITGYSANFGVQEDKRDIFKTKPKLNYRLNVSKLKYKTVQKMKTEKTNYSGKVYCATVSTGMIIVRQNKKVFISGNCQNLYAEEVQALTTRIGEGSQMIFLGDDSGVQTDVKNKKDGLSYLLGIVDKYDIPNVGITYLGYEDILRHDIVREFVIAFDKEQIEEKERHAKKL